MKRLEAFWGVFAASCRLKLPYWCSLPPKKRTRMALEQRAAGMRDEVLELGQEASRLASATELCLDELLQHAEELRRVRASSSGQLVAGRSACRNFNDSFNSDLGRPMSPLDELSLRPWKSRFENFIRQRREHADLLAASDESAIHLEQALGSAKDAIDEADCIPSMRQYLKTTLRMVEAMAAAESRRRALLVLSEDSA